MRIGFLRERRDECIFCIERDGDDGAGGLLFVFSQPSILITRSLSLLLTGYEALRGAFVLLQRRCMLDACPARDILFGLMG